MWHLGYGRIAVIPSINLEYTDEAARKIKSTKGYVSRWVESEGDNDMPLQIEWESSAPPLVKCIPAGWSSQIWVPWDEQLAEHEMAP